LYLKKPVVLGLEVDESFDKLPPNRTWKPQNPNKLDKHAVCVIGYDDKKQAFEILDRGLCWLALNDAEQLNLRLPDSLKGKAFSLNFDNAF
jgi:hypothetical protein